MFPYTFTHNGRSFTARLEADDSSDAPWDNSDCTGIVRTVRVYGGLRYKGVKRPGERVLHSDGRTYWLYDWQATCKKARDVWGCKDVHAQVTADFKRLQGWLQDDWHYAGMIVSADDGETEPESLWGIESDSGDFLTETAHELAAQHADAYVHVLGA
jgi:hypothetical protein